MPCLTVVRGNYEIKFSKYLTISSAYSLAYSNSLPHTLLPNNLPSLSTLYNTFTKIRTKHYLSFSFILILALRTVLD